MLVDRDGRSLYAAAGVGNTQRLEHPLDGAVLAAAPMQCDEDAIEPRRLEFGERLRAGIERVRIDAPTAQCVEHTGTRHQGDLALGRAAAEQHADLAEADMDGFIPRLHR